MKKDRLDEIIHLVQQEDIETQEELTALLNQAGFSVTQATVSRDIRKLGLVKRPTQRGRMKYMLPSGEENLTRRQLEILKASVLSMEPAMNLLVIKTSAGMAMAAGAALDDLKLPEIVGAVAGDDTILVATKSPKDAELLQNALLKLLS
ncbi:MAG: arginine repressor [Lachnospiraceae bacterium]|nr:arginine repressor [Lachnospiraceae bacterium]